MKEFDFIQGNVRYYLFGIAPFLFTKYFKEKLADRKIKAKPCYDNGACLHCGCTTPQLFYADRGCSKELEPCYKPLTPLWKRIGTQLLKILGK